MTKFQQAAALVAIAGLALGAGVAVALPQSEDVATEPVAAEATTTTRERPTTTMRPTTTTTAPMALAVPTTVPPPVVVYETPVVEPSRPTCDAACTADILDGWGTGSATTVPPCRPSTYRACDPAEPMDLPVYGCDVLETTYSGDVRCVG